MSERGGPQPDYTALGFPSAEYITWNLQSVARYAELNGGSFRFPVDKPLKKMPLSSLVIHFYKDGYAEVRVIREEEYKLEKILEKDRKKEGVE